MLPAHGLECPFELAKIVHTQFVELHPHEVAARGLAEGSQVTVTSPAGSVKATLRSSTDTPPGAAFLLFDQPGLHANELMAWQEDATWVEVTA